MLKAILALPILFAASNAFADCSKERTDVALSHTIFGFDRGQRAALVDCEDRDRTARTQRLEAQTTANEYNARIKWGSAKSYCGTDDANDMCVMSFLAVYNKLADNGYTNPTREIELLAGNPSREAQAYEMQSRYGFSPSLIKTAQSMMDNKATEKAAAPSNSTTPTSPAASR